MSFFHHLHSNSPYSLHFLDSGLLNLKPGTTYKYDYDGKINIELSSAENQKTTTEVKAKVLLTQQADCKQVLKLQSVQVIGPDGKVKNNHNIYNFWMYVLYS